jgi:hypothetical protein
MAESKRRHGFRTGVRLRGHARPAAEDASLVAVAISQWAKSSSPGFGLARAGRAEFHRSMPDTSIMSQRAALLAMPRSHAYAFTSGCRMYGSLVSALEVFPWILPGSRRHR